MSKNRDVEAFLSLWTNHLIGDPLWTLASVDVADIDIDASLRNQARDVALDKEHVARIVAAQDAGLITKPVIFRKKAKKMVVIDGNHRVAAARETGRPVLGYIVECSDTAFTAMAAAANLTNGKGLGPREIVEHVKVMLALGFTSAETSRVYGINESTISHMKNSWAGRDKMIEAGIKSPTQVGARLVALNRFEIDHLKIAGALLQAQSEKNLSALAREYEKTPSAKRLEWAYETKGRLEERAVEQLRPKVTPAQRAARDLLRQLRKPIPIASASEWSEKDRAEAESLISARMSELQSVLGWLRGDERAA